MSYQANTKYQLYINYIPIPNTNTIKLQNQFTGNSPKKLFSCQLCGKLLCSKASLKRHIADKHAVRQEEYRCAICERVYCSRNSLMTHIYTYHKSRPGEMEMKDIKLYNQFNSSIWDLTPLSGRKAMTKNQIKYANQFKNNFKIYNCDNNDNMNNDELDSITTNNSTISTTQHAMPVPMPGHNEQYPLLLQERQIMTLYDYYLHQRNGNCNSSYSNNGNINNYSTIVKSTSN